MPEPDHDELAALDFYGPESSAGAREDSAADALDAYVPAEPDDDPPVVRSGAAGLTGGGKCSLSPPRE